MSATPARVLLPRADPPTDPRSARFAAALTAVVALGVLITSNEALFAALAVVFALGALLGPRYAPFPALHRLVAGPGSVRPASRPARPAATYRFAQTLGLALALAGSLGYWTGLHPLGASAAALVLLGGALDAVTGISPGAEVHQVITKLAHRPSTS
jgi:hypothetical protein